MADGGATGKVPWLMLPYAVSPSDLTTRQFFLLSNDDNPHMHETRLPELDSADCHGLNHPSWLLVVRNGVKSSPFLFDPTTRSQISLPPLPPPAFWNQCLCEPNFLNLTVTPDYDENHHRLLGPEFYAPLIHSAAISKGNRDDLEVMVSHGWDSKLLFCRPGDAHWTPVADDEYQDGRESHHRRVFGCRPPASDFQCLTYCNGQFYAAHKRDHLVVCDTRTSPPTISALLSFPFVRKEPWERDASFFLLASSSPDRQELLLVIKSDVSDFRQKKKKLVKEESRVYAGFQVFKLVEGGRVEWSRMGSIGDQAIFVCGENAFAISTKDGDHDIVRPDCIYYSDLLVEKHPKTETSAVVIEFSVLKKKQRRVINCGPPSSLCLWQSLWFQPSCLPLEEEKFCLNHE